MNISVVGLGYVGTVVAGCLAKAGHRVFGVDIESGKVDLVNLGTSPIVEPEIEEILYEQVTQGRLSATKDLLGTGAEVRGWRSPPTASDWWRRVLTVPPHG